jgi:RNA 2',3'-cyclic 3'-phosphodiesterase
MRAFIAIDLAPEVKNNILSLMDECKRIQNKFIKYVEDENIHLTLKFLGDAKPEILNQLGKELENIKIGAFQIKSAGTGAFPNVFFPKVIWAGIAENEDLKKLFDQIESEAEKYGFSKEDRIFHPHITLARLNGAVSRDLTGFLKEHKNSDMGVSRITEFSIYQSELTPDGPIYTRLKSIPLI